jgi:hypothetical protein
MKPSLGHSLARSEQMVGRRIASEYVLVPLVGRGADIDAIFNLNRVGAFIWERLDGRTEGSAVVEALMEHFTVDRATAEADYLRFVEQLKSIGAVTGPATR